MPRKVSKKKATGVGAGAGADRKAAASAAAAAEEEEEDRGAQDPDAHPYALGSWLVVRWLPDASDRLCTVIERAKVEDPEQMAPDTSEAARDGGGDDDACWRYYVHYADFNRRMDEWVKPDRVSRTPTAAAASAAAEGRVAPSTAAAEECAAPATTVAPPAAAAAAASPEAPLETSPEAPRVFSGGSGALAFGAARKRRKADSAADALTSVEDMEHDEHEGINEASLREHEEVTKVKNVGRVELGRFTVERTARVFARAAFRGPAAHARPEHNFRTCRVAVRAHGARLGDLPRATTDAAAAHVGRDVVLLALPKGILPRRLRRRALHRRAYV